MLTPDQINQIRIKSGLKPISNQNQPLDNQNYVGKYDYLKNNNNNNETDGFSFFNEVGKSIENRFGNIKDIIFKKGAEGEINPVSVGLQSVGQSLGAVGDIIGAGLAGIIGKGGREKLKNITSDVTSNETIKNLVQSYQDFKKQNPEMAGNIEALANILSFAPGGFLSKPALNLAKSGGKSIIKTGEELAKTGIENVSKKAIKLGEKASDIITPIDEAVENVLTKPTINLDQLKKYAKVAREAVEDYSKKTPLELAGEKAEEALNILSKKIEKYGQQKTKIIEKLAHIDADDIANNAIEKMKKLLKERVGLTIADGQKLKYARNRVATISDRADLKLINDVNNKLNYLIKKPTFQKIDDIIDYMQDLVFKRKSLTAIPVNKKVEGIIKNVIHDLKEGLEKIGGEEYVNINKAYSHTKSIYDKLNKALGLEGNKGAALMKQLFSPTGTAPRKLFNDVFNKTGINLVDEATLAKFVMESIGDSRQASILEQIIKGGSLPRSKRGLIGLATEYLISKLQNPIAKAERIIKKSH